MVEAIAAGNNSAVVYAPLMARFQDRLAASGWQLPAAAHVLQVFSTNKQRNLANDRAHDEAVRQLAASVTCVPWFVSGCHSSCRGERDAHVRALEFIERSIWRNAGLEKSKEPALCKVHAELFVGGRVIFTHSVVCFRHGSGVAAGTAALFSQGTVSLMKGQLGTVVELVRVPTTEVRLHVCCVAW